MYSCINIIKKNLSSIGYKIRTNEERFPKRKYRNYILLYTILFIVMAGIVFQYFYTSGKSFIWNSALMDGWTQHYKALIYYAQWMRQIIIVLITQHQLLIPTWSFSIGYGSDILTTLHYYVIGDPLDLFAVFIPVKSMVYFYGGLIILRLYLAGLAFSAYCFYMKASNRIGILAGTFVYVFCGFALYAAVRHPYFANPMIYLPLLLLGTERILRKEKPYLFIGMVFLCAVSNFYFFYMLVILTVIYVIFRIFTIYKRQQIKEAGYTILRLFGYAVTGCSLSAFLFLPVLNLFFSDSRSSIEHVHGFFYELSYYHAFLGSFVSYAGPGYWNIMGYCSVVLLAVFLLFIKKRKYTDLKIGFLLLTIFLLLPMAGNFFNGFSYVANRWIWGYSMLVAYILVFMWKDLLYLKIRESIYMLLLLAVYFIFCQFLDKSRVLNMGFSMFLALAALFIFVIWQFDLSGKYIIHIQILIISIILISIAGNAFYGYSLQEGNYISQFKDMDTIDTDLTNTQDTAVKMAAVNDTEQNNEEQSSQYFYRYSGNNLQSNTTLYSGLSSTQYYWSLSNGNITKFMSDLSLLENISFSYKALDNRTMLNALASVKYFVVSGASKQTVPYGYSLVNDEKIKKQTGYTVYRNDNTLPLGYTYSGYFTQDEYMQMTPGSRQEALLQGVLLKDELKDSTRADLKFTNQTIDYEIQDISGEVKIDDGSFIVTSQNAAVTLQFDGLSNSETYLEINGLEFTGINPLDSYTADDWQQMSIYDRKLTKFNNYYWTEPTYTSLLISGNNSDNVQSTKTINYYTAKHMWYNNRHDYLVNLGYNSSNMSTITIAFPDKGVYSFDKISVICQPMDNYVEQINQLKEDILEDVDISTNQITGRISLDTSKILCLSLPYSSGWEAYVDGEKTNLMQANTMYMAINLSKGMHQIKLVYHTPGLKVGIIISIIGLLMVFTIIFWKKRRMNNEDRRYDDSRNAY